MKSTPSTRNALVAVALAALVIADRSAGSTSTLAWDPPGQNTDGSPVTNLAGYIVYYGQESGSYEHNVDVGNVTSYELPGLDDGQVYYAAVKAYNTFEMQSGNSDELTWTAPDEIAPSISAPEQIAVTGNENDQAEIPDVIAEATITDNCSDRPNITVTQDPLAGTLVGLGTTPVTLAATDEAGNTAEAIVNILVAAMNRPPDVNAGGDQSIRLPVDTVALVGTATDDGLPEGSSVSVEWTMASGPAAVTFGDVNALSTTATFTEEGTYVLRLTATDGDLTAHDEVTVTVTPKPVPMPPSNLHVSYSGS